MAADPFPSTDASGSRLLDMALEDGAPRSPLSGLFPANLPLPSLEVALTPHSATLPHLHPSTGPSVKIARKQAKRAQAKHPDITLDECTAIVLYTMEEIPRETSLYYVLNLALRNKVRAAVRPWRDYIWLLLHALRKLPPSTEVIVFRGCKKSPDELGLELTKDFEFTWSSFTSTATTQGVMQTFLGQSGPRTLMTIKMAENSGRDVRDFSLYPGENEILFPPNLCFEVVDSFDAGNQLIMVQCRQTETVDVILDLNSAGNAVGASAAKPGSSTQPSEAGQLEKAVVKRAVDEKAADELKHWKMELDKMANARALLCTEQARVRLMAAAAADEDESLRDAVQEWRNAVQARNAARVALVRALDDALRVHDERHAEEQRRSLSMEAAALQQQQGARKLTLAEQLRLECLHSQVLPVLDEWVKQIGRVREEREDLDRHAERPSTDKLHALHEAWLTAHEAFDLFQAREKDERRRGSASDAAIQVTRQARRDVQSAERALHRERTMLAQVAAAHFPELFAMEPLLQVGKAEGLDDDEIRAVLVLRELSHYEDRVSISAKEGRHEVWKASYDGKACVLREYKLDNPSEWKLLAKEVRLLSQLSHCPFIAPVEAVFVQHSPERLYLAYIQLPYFSGGNMRSWLSREPAPELLQRKVLLGQLCEALRHVHNHGLAHGDVKLENVLVSLEGERATAHLADFESARRQQTQGARNSLRASTVGGIAFTELYVAPEILKASREGRERDAKPTAMGDMFSYGVCCLFACCLPPTAEEQQKCIRRFDVEDDRMLSAWSREAAKQADAHLPDLLESLLADAATSEEALARRLSASQTLRHAFLDTAAALELSTKAQQAAAKASQEAEQQMAAVEQEAARRDREAAWREAEQRRRQAEQEEALEAALKQSELEAAAKRNEIQREQRRLEEWRQNVREQQAEAETKARAAWQLTSDAKREATQERAQAQKRRKELEAEEKRVALECARRKAEAESAEAKATKERDELRIERKKARAMPDYWETRIATSSPDGFAAIALDPGRDRSTWAALERLLQTDPVKLKQSGADRSGTTHDRLKLACAWRLENPALWEKYMSGVQGVMNDMERIRQGRVASAKRIRQCRVASKGALPGDLRVDVNEAFLMHGTNAGVLINILSTGMNERFAGTAAGAVYGKGSALEMKPSLTCLHASAHYGALPSPLWAPTWPRTRARLTSIPRQIRSTMGARNCTSGCTRTARATNRARSSTSSCAAWRSAITCAQSRLVGMPRVPIRVDACSRSRSASSTRWPAFLRPCTTTRCLHPTRPHHVRYREYLVFHYPEYLLAYQRYEGNRGPLE